MRLATTIVHWGRMIRFSHSAFALPFALSGAVLAAAGHTWEYSRLVWIAVAMVAARSAAMGFNRLVDEPFDARNPRTANRELPSGRLSRHAVRAFTGLCALLFVLAMIQLDLAWLAAPALALTLGYSYTKRFTWASHLVLGAALALAPIGGWLAIAGELAPAAVLLGLAVASWVAGFDVIYACQDIEFDRIERLHSIPARFGPRRALAAARWLHAGAFVFLVGVGIALAVHPVYWIGLGAVAVILIHEHRLVASDNPSAMNAAFFRSNATLSAVYLANVLAAVWLQTSGGA